MAAGTATSNSLTFKVTCSVPQSSWVAKAINETYALLRIAPCGNMGRPLVEYIINKYNDSIEGGRIFSEMVSLELDASVGMWYMDHLIPGNDFVALVKGCKMTDKVTFIAPIKLLMSQWIQKCPNFKQVYEAQPEFHRFTITKMQLSGVTPRRKRTAQGILQPAASAKRSRLTGVGATVGAAGTGVAGAVTGANAHSDSEVNQ